MVKVVERIGYIENNNGKFDIVIAETSIGYRLATTDGNEFDLLNKVNDRAEAKKLATEIFRTQPTFVMLN